MFDYLITLNRCIAVGIYIDLRLFFFDLFLSYCFLFFRLRGRAWSLSIFFLFGSYWRNRCWCSTFGECFYQLPTHLNIFILKQIKLFRFLWQDPQIFLYFCDKIKAFLYLQLIVSKCLVPLNLYRQQIATLNNFFDLSYDVCNDWNYFMTEIPSLAANAGSS